MKSADAAARVANECLAFRSRRLARVVSRLYDDALRDEGLTVAQLVLLAAIEHEQAPSAAELGAVLEIDKSTLCRNLRLLESRGWIARRPSGEGRAMALGLTPAGRGRLRAAIPAWERAQEAARKRLGPEALGALDTLLPF
ncbi:MAG: MarR family transcriptional regulator [Myxococcota bacterium]